MESKAYGREILTGCPGDKSQTNTGVSQPRSMNRQNLRVFETTEMGPNSRHAVAYFTEGLWDREHQQISILYGTHWRTYPQWTNNHSSLRQTINEPKGCQIFFFTISKTDWYQIIKKLTLQSQTEGGCIAVMRQPTNPQWIIVWPEN